MKTTIKMKMKTTMMMMMMMIMTMTMVMISILPQHSVVVMAYVESHPTQKLQNSIFEWLGWKPWVVLMH